MSPQPAPEPRYQPAGKPLQQKKHRRVGLKRKLFLLLLGCFLLGLVIIAQYSSMVALNYRLSQACLLYTSRQRYRFQGDVYI